MVSDVLLVVVDFVVGAPVGAVAVGVVASAVFVAVAGVGGFESVGDAFADGGCVVVGGVGVGIVVYGCGFMVCRWRLGLRVLE